MSIWRAAKRAHTCLAERLLPAALLLILLATPVRAGYPDRPVTLIMPFPQAAAWTSPAEPCGPDSPRRLVAGPSS